ncbi:MAG TPA: dihydrolipoamide acetyltransferase family protein [Solirubrobacteraceae bacterium]|nr:dihydrolipoamide acetyltransferase family protein [Solirubrobacteraceae bacterium]
MAELVMPRLSDTMEEGTILRWLVADGDEIARGQEIVEIETDKATMVYESDLAGVLSIVAAEGDTLPVGTLIAHVGEASGAGAASEASSGETAGPAVSAPASAPAQALREESTSPGASASGAAPPPAESAPPEPPPPESGPTDTGERVKASPLARRLAAEQGVDLHGLAGSGPGGRIVKADVLAAGGGTGASAAQADTTAAAALGAAQQAPSPSAPTTAPAGGLTSVATAKGESTEVELTRTQQTIARRMAESKATVPHFALAMDVDMEECAKLRAQLKQHATDAVPTYNDMVVKACALALREHPRANSSYRDGRLQLHSRVNVGVAVAVEGEGEGPAGGALVVPTVFDADLKALGEISREARALAAKVREGTITPPELGGGTFTVSNLGMYGIASFTAIVNPPQAAILSVGAVAPRAVVREGEIVARQTMTVTLACDHRILYGADAAQFLARIRELLQAPAALTL